MLTAIVLPVFTCTLYIYIPCVLADLCNDIHECEPDSAIYIVLGVITSSDIPAHLDCAPKGYMCNVSVYTPVSSLSWFVLDTTR